MSIVDDNRFDSFFPGKIEGHGHRRLFAVFMSERRAACGLDFPIITERQNVNFFSRFVHIVRSLGGCSVDGYSAGGRRIVGGVPRRGRPGSKRSAMNQRALLPMIRKTTIHPATGKPGGGFDLGAIASFELSSEDAQFPFENALEEGRARWKAAGEGLQTIRIKFDVPQQITRITLEFEEGEVSRTQEFSVAWNQAGSERWTEIRRQQFNFSHGTTTEVETLEVRLTDVAALELRITPSISGGGVASLTAIQIR